MTITEEQARALEEAQRTILAIGRTIEEARSRLNLTFMPVAGHA